MFEREVMISSLRKSSHDLSKLVEELEEKQRFEGVDMRYFQEALKKIETALRKVRKMDEKAGSMAERYSVGFASRVW